mmetsp:Transcript_16179/g.39792  ORF Transcript_16179/g.39792 Transcript_16179/m.39792 type:complete len:225 (-) Transcript_16179:445-1119(-)
MWAVIAVPMPAVEVVPDDAADTPWVSRCCLCLGVRHGRLRRGKYAPLDEPEPLVATTFPVITLVHGRHRKRLDCACAEEHAPASGGSAPPGRHHLGAPLPVRGGEAPPQAVAVYAHGRGACLGVARARMRHCSHLPRVQRLVQRQRLEGRVSLPWRRSPSSRGSQVVRTRPSRSRFLKLRIFAASWEWVAGSMLRRLRGSQPGSVAKGMRDIPAHGGRTHSWRR